jgi:hypothetical protein
MRVKEGDYRHVSELRVACESQGDLDRAARGLEDLGVTFTRTDGWLSAVDPIQGHHVRLEITEAATLSPAAPRSSTGRDGANE